ncbi:nucleoside triphosphate hydrolase [Salipiger bermudensis]|uniref:nucleoside triphosphate hydrolase n=1 Tax=Salipiger bermudensis TaxID=344736 RepID=UPI001C997C8F|nr:nucleoside triphosphate hydrolase [Salipiger bermudensis]MBY6005020.1 nucleoside triphosphate hydrolase [Salipiger bermudensis]
MSENLDVATIAERLTALAGGNGRVFVAIAGAPASGKSTLAEILRDMVDRAHPGKVEILPMDGFHYDDAVLRARGTLARKGAPHTFDADGLAALLDRLATSERPVAVPVFDRALEISRAAARIIAPDVRLILVEGNYLLLDDPDWARLRPRFDLTVFVDVPVPVLEQRLTERWGGLDPQVAQAKIADNDLPNARLVAEQSVAADIVLKG